MFRKFTFMLAVGIATLANGPASAHGDTGKPLYVAPNGVDTGDCTDRQSPCRSIPYVLGLAGKGAQIKVAAGTYPIDDTSDLFHIISGVMDVTGGYKPEEDFSVAGAGTSFLTGVPIEFRELLASRGFNVIADRKGIDGAKAAEALKMLGLHEQLKSSQPAAACVNGTAGGLPCSAVDLLSHMAFQDISAFPSSSNDVWGFVDLNTGREYVIAGFNTGTAVIDVTNPELPREVGFIDGQNATWRDIKVHQFFNRAAGRWNAYAYVTTDGSSDGLFVIDLSGLPQRISRVGYSSDFSAAHNVFASGVDFSTGLALAGASPTLVIAGSNISGGQYRSYSLANPASPVFVGGASSSADYMHDAASVRVSDARKDTQCVNAVDFCEVLLDFNESTVDLWDVTVPASPQRLSRTPYTNARYTHSGWPSEDGRYVFVHDELDEQGLGLNTTVRVFSIANLAVPQQVGSWTGPTRAIDHNGFVRGNRYYMSNYSRGLTILDISNPAAPVEAGRIDTYPYSDSSSFVGAWGAYPYLHSRVVAISDINSGLYLVADRTRDVAQGSLGFVAPSFAANEGATASLQVSRSGGSTGNVSVDYQLIPATASMDDFQAISGTLAWNAGDSANQSIDVNAIADGVNEGMERVLVRLVNPAGGATLGDIATASLYINDPGAAAEIATADATINVNERGFATAVVVVQRVGSANGAASIDYAITAATAMDPEDFSGPAAGTLSWADGDGDAKWIEYEVVDDGLSEGTEYIELTLSNAVGATLTGSPTVRIDIEDGNGTNQAPKAVAGSGQTVAAGAAVSLNGSGSNDPNGDPLSFEWVQTSGPPVALNDADASIAHFTAPSVQSDTLLQFRLTVRDPAGLDNFATTSVVVTTSSSASGSSGGGAADWLLLLSLAGFSGVRSRRRQSKG